jgi:hypothetical protein
MSYIGNILTLIGVLLVALGGFVDPWFIATATDETTPVFAYQLIPGQLALSVAALAGLMTFIGMFLRRRAIIVSESLSALILFGLLAWAFFDSHGVIGAGDQFQITTERGFFNVLLGAFTILIGALWVFGANPPIDAKHRPLRVAMLWNGSVIQEKIFMEPHSVTVGENINNTFTLPQGCGLPETLRLFTGTRTGKYSLSLGRDMDGQLHLGGKSLNVQQCIEQKSSGTGGLNDVQLDSDDWGILHFGPLAVFFQFVRPIRVRMAGAAAFADSNILAAFSSAAVVHIGLILMALFVWAEHVDMRRRPHIFKQLSIAAVYDTEKDAEEEEEDEGEEEDTTGKRAEGEEGKFGDPEIDPEIESKVPQNEGKMVSKIDPKKVGLVDVLQGNKIAAISNILSNNAQGLSDKMAIAMAGAGSEFVMGHGSGGMGFKGTGTGGGGEGGYGRIHGLGKIDTGGGTGMHASLGRKGVKKVGKLRIGSGSSAGFCKKGDISRVVRRRAGAIRACYEQRLQVNASLRGKVTVRWTISTSGSVSGASAIGNTLGDGAATNCILRNIRRMRFPKPEGGICKVQWPFVFNSGG